MNDIKRMHRPKCSCGKLATEGSVFCICCRAAVKRKNVKLLSRERVLFIKKR